MPQSDTGAAPSLKLVNTDGPSGERLAAVETALRELSKGLRAVSFYPGGHPSLDTALDRTWTAVTAAIAGDDELMLSVSRDGVSFGSAHLGKNNPAAIAFGRELYLRQIKRLFFLPDVSVRDLEHFLRVLALDPDECRGKGRVEELLTERGITTIFANAVNFDQGAGVAADVSPDRDSAPPGRRVTELLKALEDMHEPEAYREAAVELQVYAKQFEEEMNFGPIVQVLWTLGQHAAYGSGKVEAVQREAARTARAIATPGFIEFLFGQVSQLSGPRKERLIAIAVSLEDVVIDPLLTRLSANDAIYADRELVGLLLAMGDGARQKVRSALASPEPRVVRKMAFILGEWKDAASLTPLVNATHNRDMRVRTEAVRAIGKLATPEAVQCLARIVDEQETPELHRTAIRALGDTGMQAAAPSLIRLVENRRRYFGTIDVVMDAIRALGRLGTDECVAALATVLTTRSLFNKAVHDELALEAVEALAAIDTPAAHAALETGAASKRHAVADACRRVLTKWRAPDSAGEEPESGAAPTDEDAP